MSLHRASRWADKTEIRDAYAPGPVLMRAQISSYIDNQQDGSISKRRVISFAPGSTLPSRRVITYLGETWLVGDVLQDAFKGRAVRVSAATKKATGLYTIRTPGQAALGAGGTAAYGQLIYLKDTVNTTNTSQYSPQFEIYFSSTETVVKGQVIVGGSNYYHVRSFYPLLDGFVCAVSDELGPDCRQAATLRLRGAYNASTDSYSETTVNTFGILIDFYKLYGYETAIAYKAEVGDMTLVIANSVGAPKVGDSAVISGIVWNILGSTTDSDAYRLHIRRQG